MAFHMTCLARPAEQQGEPHTHTSAKPPAQAEVRTARLTRASMVPLLAKAACLLIASRDEPPPNPGTRPARPFSQKSCFKNHSQGAYESRPETRVWGHPGCWARFHVRFPL